MKKKQELSFIDYYDDILNEANAIGNKFNPTCILMHRKDYKRYRRMIFWNKVKSIFRTNGLARNYRSRN